MNMRNNNLGRMRGFDKNGTLCQFTSDCWLSVLNVMQTKVMVMFKLSLVIAFTMGMLGVSALADYVQIGTPGGGWSQKPWCGY
jgi:hypothetical protein